MNTIAEKPARPLRVFLSVAAVFLCFGIPAAVCLVFVMGSSADAESAREFVEAAPQALRPLFGFVYVSSGIDVFALAKVVFIVLPIVGATIFLVGIRGEMEIERARKWFAALIAAAAIEAACFVAVSAPIIWFFKEMADICG